MGDQDFAAKMAIAEAYTAGIAAEQARVCDVVTDLTAQNGLRDQHGEPVGASEIADIIRKTGTRGLPPGFALHPDGTLMGVPLQHGTLHMNVSGAHVPTHS